MPTPDSKLTFGKHKGKPLKALPLSYLQWMADNLRDSDLHDWARAAESFLASTGQREQRKLSLDEQADQVLRDHGIDPDRVEPT